MVILREIQVLWQGVQKWVEEGFIHVDLDVDSQILAQILNEKLSWSAMENYASEGDLEIAVSIECLILAHIQRKYIIKLQIS